MSLFKLSINNAVVRLLVSIKVTNFEYFQNCWKIEKVNVIWPAKDI